MKNYYELLEVSEKASPEVIKKAYTTLVKKYHPDLQPDGEKKAAEEKIKEINEAYEVLSNNSKRQSYDKKLQVERITAEKVKAKINDTQNNYSNKNTTNNYQKKVIHKPHMYDGYSNTADNFNQFQKDYTDMMNEAYNNAYNQAYNNAYNQAYINNLKNMGYEIEYERPFKEKIKIAFSVILGILSLIFIGFILWLIPPVKEYFINLYNHNEAFKVFMDVIGNIFKSFSNLFN